MSNWNLRGISGQCFTGPSPSAVLIRMAEFVDEWTEGGESMDRFVSDVTIRYSGDGDDYWQGVVYTEDTSHISALIRAAVGADSTSVDGEKRDAGLDDYEELDYDTFESEYETHGGVVNIGHINVYCDGVSLAGE